MTSNLFFRMNLHMKNTTPMKALRNALGGTQYDIAFQIGVDHTLICHAERGKGLGRQTTLAICDVYAAEMGRLKLTAEDFLRGEIAA